VVPAAGFLRRVADFCAGHGIVVVADEVQTGFGRTGDWFASTYEGIVPDLVTTAKGIAGGLPLGGVTGRAELMDAVHVSGLGGTFGGNPVACAAALGAIATIEADDLVGRARRIGELALPRLHALAERHPQIGDVRGRGAMLAVELVAGDGDRTPNPTLLADVVRRCAAEGVVVLTAGTYGNVLRLLPPLVIGEDLLLDALDVLDGAFAAALG
jgi:4-aminobutyrate aminotransferase/(S)-3-amino-2-methylpropionate transaminase